jgi:2',3'-cyclic-nucleotide 2'-phosphodiesterase (5'-nucleotidase family)
MAPRLLHYSDVENAYDDPERIGRLAGRLRALDGDDAAVCGTGDNTSPGVLALTSRGRQSLPFFDAVRPVAETFGNHDFDYGVPATRELVRESPMPWLTVNVREDDADGTDPADDAVRFGGDAGTEPWTLVERDGETVGLFGVTDPKTPSINPNANGVTFVDPIESARRAADHLRDAGADHVVCLSHLGAGDETLAVEADVDVVLGGHVHSERVERVDGTLLTRPGVNGHVVLEVDLDGEPTATRHRVADAPCHDPVADAMRELEADAGLDEVVATVDDPVERTQSAAFRGESRIGNFVADAYRWATDADVGLQNSGGIREGDPLEGEVTVADLVSLIPFEEPIAVAELTGAELRDVLRESSGANVDFGEAHWWHGHVSGARIVWDADEHELQDARVGDRWAATAGGDDADAPIDPDATYTLATSEYLFHTDHEFPTLDEAHRVDTGDLQYEVLAAYAREVGVDPVVSGRVVRRSADDAGTAETGTF